ncbi:MAG: hypothetical protein ABEI54_02830 [Candidatus Bipolaricaulia bacterium]
MITEIPVLHPGKNTPFGFFGRGILQKFVKSVITGIVERRID